MDDKRVEQLKRLPKIDLHLHLDGSVKPETIRALAHQQGKALPEGNHLLSRMQIDEDCADLREYLSKFDFVLPFLQTAEALERVAFEVVEQAANQGCIYIEVRYAPLLHTKEGLCVEDVIGHVREGLRRGERQFGVIARAIVICMRHDRYDRNEAVIRAAASRYGDGVAAVDLAGDEAGFPPKLHRPLFELARRLGLPVTIHAGEAGGAENVIEAIAHLGAVRIGHGVRIDGHSEAMELVRSTRTPLELCPISNMQTKAVSSWEAYPLKRFLDSGIAVTVNTDNLTVSGTTITLEYIMLMRHCGLTLQDIGKLIRNGAEASFLEEPLKTGLIERVNRQLAEQGL
ncbi:adenosine deaminase [Paenibacillus radicis (ex Gao et al. 2016)]|uniref:adenosine deaminase n=1 Tax=Paenibacillus radicis (ex Gao et al. 2016) TaxID=1737354 RepID=A0A917HHZ7_9BACL|nr:adenosine deaminase [Paenibacillus radicis (ex Gao et al. 2016)]GGG79631.1 adenosine deaminase [Paenibacillus radicis (ex Gao et al. 2016)]